jgi:hypothetical protein
VTSIVRLAHGFALPFAVLSSGALLLRSAMHRLWLHWRDESLDDADSDALRERDQTPWLAVASGAVAGTVALKLLGGDKSIALYAFVRLLQSVYNDARARQLWPDDAGPVFNLLRAHGDAFLFMITTAQVMFAYVCAPWSLPPSYYNFILTTGPMHEAALQALRRRNFSRPLNAAAMHKYYVSAGGERNFGAFPTAALGLADTFSAATATAAAATSSMTTTTTTTATATAIVTTSSAISSAIVKTTQTTRPVADIARVERWLLPCSVLHPHTSSCTYASVLTFKNAFARSYPVYATVFGFAALYRMRQSLRAPGATLLHVAKSSVQSTTFLAAFVAACMALVCLDRRVFPREVWQSYWGLSFIASSCIWIERKSRRSELALYVLPRALDSAYLILTSRRPALRVADGLKRYALFAAACGGLFHYFLHQPKALHPLLLKVLDVLVDKERDEDQLH